MKNSPQQILTNAIRQWRPKSLVSLFSGGYDSAVTTHLLHTLDTHGLSIHVAAIDTQLAADGWREYVTTMADKQGWDFKIYSSEKAWQQFLTLVIHQGCPKSRKMHTYVFQKLKGRVIEAIHMDQKAYRSDKTIFISGMRRAESSFRKEAAEVQRIGHSNRIFVAPIVHWSQSSCDQYRVEEGLLDNPFYGTVKGSGDCQCNWGDFITLETLRKHSPTLAAGNVALIDKLSHDLHGFGWDSRDVAAQAPLITQGIEDVKLTTPFLCQGCSRAKVRAPSAKVEEVMLQRGLL
jgi:3'-phosphoadenosine 5'-phosphosulfate sulfotransferase (PAPS reductase)/FAD synthetase